MNSDSEAFQSQFLAWLLQPASTAAPPNGECNRIDGVEDPLASSSAAPHGTEAEGFSPQTFELGEIPAVQDRFHAVLKRRLQIEIQQHPPLFPWETEVSDYFDGTNAAWVETISAQLWAAQQQNLSLPVPLPARVFTRLLNKCQAVGRLSSLQLGAKLVQAVEEIFPDQSQTLNELAGMVLVGNSRSALLDDPGAASDLPSDYEAATPPQQMVVSLLAARQLLETLTLSVSPSQVAKRQWLTAAGLLQIQAEYQSQAKVPRLRVEGELPCGGSLTLQGGNVEATAHSASPGYLSVELFGVVPNQSYPLEVKFPELDGQPLIFAIYPMI